MDIPVSQDVKRASAFYSKKTLDWYDLTVFRLIYPMIFRCGTRRLHRLYQTHLTGNHLDVGTGTGYFLDRNSFPVQIPRVALLDYNSNCLEMSSRRLSRFAPETIQANILDPIDYAGERFDSIGVMNVLHCLPGKSLKDKCAVFDNLLPLLNPGGVIFGATLANVGVRHAPFSRRLFESNNRRGFFCNERDSVADLTEEIARRFERHEIATHGVAVLWAVWKPDELPIAAVADADALVLAGSDVQSSAAKC